MLRRLSTTRKKYVQIHHAEVLLAPSLVILTIHKEFLTEVNSVSVSFPATCKVQERVEELPTGDLFQNLLRGPAATQARHSKSMLWKLAWPVRKLLVAFYHRKLAEAEELARTAAAGLLAEEDGTTAPM